MKLPNGQRAVVSREKVVAYLLSPSHPAGMSKAAFFRRFGFDAEWWTGLERALLSHVLMNEVVETETTAYGIKYTVDGPLETPDGRNPLVRSVWQIDRGSEAPRLITARPTG